MTGTTLGVEEEFHLVETRAALLQTRAVAAAQTAGLIVLAASTHPSASPEELVLTDAPRYHVLVQRWAGPALGQDICGTHVHVGVDDLDTAVAVLDRARPYLPLLLLAMTGSSPFHDGADTGYASWRTVWWSRWPVSGSPEPLGDAAGYHAVVDPLVETGLVPDGSQLYWDLRPSTHVPTVEFRMGDVCTDLDDVVLHAALCRSLVSVLARDDAAVPVVRPEVLRAARWKAARAGMTGELFDPVTTELVPAETAGRSLLAFVSDDLAERGDLDEVTALTEQLLGRGTSSARQRRTLHRTGDPGAVVRDLLEVGGTAGQ